MSSRTRVPNTRGSTHLRQDVPRLGLLNLKYDAMPSEYVTMVVTEFGMIPPSSVPAILRELQNLSSGGAL